VSARDRLGLNEVDEISGRDVDVEDVQAENR